MMRGTDSCRIREQLQTPNGHFNNLNISGKNEFVDLVTFFNLFIPVKKKKTCKKFQPLLCFCPAPVEFYINLMKHNQSRLQQGTWVRKVVKLD